MRIDFFNLDILAQFTWHSIEKQQTWEREQWIIQMSVQRPVISHKCHTYLKLGTNRCIENKRLFNVLMQHVDDAPYEWYSYGPSNHNRCRVHMGFYGRWCKLIVRGNLSSKRGSRNFFIVTSSHIFSSGRKHVSSLPSCAVLIHSVNLAYTFRHPFQKNQVEINFLFGRLRDAGVSGESHWYWEKLWDECVGVFSSLVPLSEFLCRVLGTGKENTQPNMLYVLLFVFHP